MQRMFDRQDCLRGTLIGQLFPGRRHLRRLPPPADLRAQLRFQFAQVRDRLAIPLRRVERVGHPPGAHEHTRQRVIIPLRDGVELVIVALGAGDGRRLEGAGEGVDLVVQHLLVDAVEHSAVAVTVFAELEEHRADQRFVDSIGSIDPRRIQQVACNLLADKLIVRNIRVERADQVVAIPPGAFGRDVPFIAVRIAIANDVHPVPGPMLAEVRRRKE